MNNLNPQQMQQEAFINQLMAQQEDATVQYLTNNRKIEGSKVDSHRNKVLQGNKMILDFIHRGVQIQVKKIKDSKHS